MYTIACTVIASASKRKRQMVRIEVDAETAQKIEQSGEPIELYDNRGRQIGFFSRPISTDEIEEARRLAALPSDGSSLDEVWKRIKSRGDRE
jgi:hypothetical protein